MMLILVLVLAGLTGVMAQRTVKAAGVYLYSSRVREAEPRCYCEEEFCPAHLLTEAIEQTHHDLRIEMFQQAGALVAGFAATVTLLYLS